MSAARELVEASAGTVVDSRYTTRREIARGGMGIVFEAEHQRTGARVAIKTLTRMALGVPAALQRIMREARALGRLRHSGIVSVFDAGVCSAFGPYLVLELVDGRPLDGILMARRQLDAAAAIALISQVAEALDWAHARGVIHRDLKPSNLMVTCEQGRDQDVVRVIDFGVAAVAGEEDGTEKLTRHGDMLGTVEYMAPEQIVAEGAVDSRADVYALGAVLYECLVGEVPFPGPAPRVITSLLSGARPTPVSERVAGIPPELDAIIDKALAARPASRFASAGEFAAACRGVVAAGRLELLERGQDAALAPVDAALQSQRSEKGTVDEVSRAREQAQARRRFARAPFVSPVRILTQAGHFDGRCEDVSEGGLLMIGEAPIQEGESVRVRFPLPASGAIATIEATARWARNSRGQRAVGVQFLDAPDTALTDIRRYVELMAR